MIHQGNTYETILFHSDQIYIYKQSALFLFIQLFQQSFVVILSAMLDRPIEYLKGIGPQRAEVLKKEIGIFIYRDLLTYYPFRYVDRTRFYTINQISEDLPHVQLRGFIDSMEVVGQKHTKRLVVLFRDNTGIIELVWFKGYNWIAQRLSLGKEYIVFGKASEFKGRFNIAHPEIEAVSEEVLKQQSAFQ